MFKDNEKLKKLIDILDMSYKYEMITEEKTNDKILKFSALYINNMNVYINITELILLLKNYSGIDRILIDNIEE